MNIKDAHDPLKEVSAVKISQQEQATVVAIQLLVGAMLKEHITKVPALLMCITGAVTYGAENGEKHQLNAGDTIHIPADVVHWLIAQEDSQLVLIK